MKITLFFLFDLYGVGDLRDYISLMENFQYLLKRDFLGSSEEMNDMSWSAIEFCKINFIVHGLNKTFSRSKKKSSIHYSNALSLLKESHQEESSMKLEPELNVKILAYYILNRYLCSIFYVRPICILFFSPPFKK